MSHCGILKKETQRNASLFLLLSRQQQVPPYSDKLCDNTDDHENVEDEMAVAFFLAYEVEHSTDGESDASTDNPHKAW